MYGRTVTCSEVTRATAHSGRSDNVHMRAVFVASLILAAAGPLRGQNQIEYRAGSETLWYQTDNPFTLYWVRGQDTLGGGPTRHVGIERHTWSSADGKLLGIVRQYSRDTKRDVKEDTFHVSISGQVLGIRGPGNVPGGRIDLLMPLPTAVKSFAVGQQWADTLRQNSGDENGPQHYIIGRRLAVKAIVDRAGRTVAEITSTGEVQFRLAFTTDSASGAFVWSDMRGPVEETFHFDVGSGQMLERTWSMDLRGTGGVPNAAGGMDTLPSGLRSRQNMRFVDSSQAKNWIRTLPGNDTTVTTAENGAVLLHVTDWKGSRVSAAFARNDGVIGTANADYRSGLPVDFVVLWTGPDFADRTIQLTVFERAVRDTAGTTYPLPEDVQLFAIADFGMDELLAPVVSALPRDGSEHRIAVFRPFTAEWSHATVALREMHGLVLAAVSYDRGSSAEYHLFSVDGKLLYVERNGQGQRLPRLTDPRRAVVEEFLKNINNSSEPRS